MYEFDAFTRCVRYSIWRQWSTSGASILVKGTSNGAQTDLDGKFTIRNVGANAVLIFTYIGLKQQSKCSWKTSVNVVLVADSAELQEVIVIGYGS
jgi:iron complex outermembrane receptor protein